MCQYLTPSEVYHSWRGCIPSPQIRYWQIDDSSPPVGGWCEASTANALHSQKNSIKLKRSGATSQWRLPRGFGFSFSFDPKIPAKHEMDFDSDLDFLVRAKSRVTPTRLYYRNTIIDLYKLISEYEILESIIVMEINARYTYHVLSNYVYSTFIRFTSKFICVFVANVCRRYAPCALYEMEENKE